MEGKNIWIINHYAIPPSMGGLSRHYYFAKELIARGNKVRLFSASAVHNTDVNMIDDSDKSKFKEVDVDGLTYTFVKCASYNGNGFSRIKNMLDFMFNVPKIRKVYKNEKPDVIYASSPDLLATYNVTKLAKKMHVPCIVEVRDLWPLSVAEYKGVSSKNPIISVLYQMEKCIYKRADALNFTMRGGYDYICDKKWNKQINKEKVFNVNNGIQYEIQQVESVNNVIDDKILTNGKFHVTYIGSIREANNIGMVIDVAKYMQEEHEDVEFLIYGKGGQKDELEKRCLSEEITNVKFMGYVDKNYVPYICSHSDVNLINVRQTGVSKYGVSWNKLFDYLAAGKPIVSTVRVNYDIIVENNCGISCKNQEIDTIANAILTIKYLPKEEYMAMCDRAHNVAKQYDFSKLTDKLEKVIDYAITHYKRK